MKKDILEKRFKHSKWFTEGVTVAYALDYCAKSGDFYLNKRSALKQSDNLFDPVIYDDVLTDGHGFYRLSEEEKQYYLEREQYWKEQKEIEEQKWLDTNIDIDKELNSYLCSNSNYDISDVEKQLNYWKNIDNDNEVDKIDFWEYESKRRNITKSIIDNCIEQFKNKISTNRDFISFKEFVSNELSKVQSWNGSRFIMNN